MIQNYLLVAWRQLLRQRGYALTNILGLAVGLTACVLISSYIHHELQYDRHHTLGDRLYRVNAQFIGQGQSAWGTHTPAPVGPSLAAEWPEVQTQTRVLRMFGGATILRFQNRVVKETNGLFADSTYFDLFSYDFQAGQPAGALQAPNSIVLDEGLATALFGNPAAALDKVIRVENSWTNADYRVTGVAAAAGPTDVAARFFLSMHSEGGSREVSAFTNYANNNMFQTFLLLHQGVDAAQVEARFPAWRKQRMAADLAAQGTQRNHRLQPVADMHLQGAEQGAGSGYTLLYILGSVQVFILGIACFNFMNLATARAQRRAREVGVRKVSGATRGMIVWQFLCEGVLITLLALVLALLALQVLLPLFNQWADVALTPAWLLSSAGALYLLGLALLAGVVASVYPALYLSSFVPAKVLTGRFKLDGGSKVIRQGLVVLQFVAAVVLTVGVLVFQQQLQYTRNKDLGVTKEPRMVIPLGTESASRAGVRLRDELMRLPQAERVTLANSYPGVFNPSDNLLHTDGQDQNSGVGVKINGTDAYFLQTMGIPLVAGRNFQPADLADTNRYGIVNQTTLRELGIPADQALGQRLHTTFGNSYTIIGVMQDYHHESLREPLRPMMLVKWSNPTPDYLVIQLAPEASVPEANAAFAAVVKRLVPDYPYESHFVDEDLARLYQQEQRQARVITLFTLVAIVLACSGLFALASFTAEQRRKEISVRKVMGASMRQISLLLTRDFLRLVVIANAIGLPLAWWATSRWLDNFAYRIEVGAGLLLAGFAITCGIALLTVLSQTLRAAATNPVQWLKGE